MTEKSERQKKKEGLEGEAEGPLKIAVKRDIDLKKFQGLSDEEIAKRFNKAVLPELIKKMRDLQRFDDDCPVCSPWCYAFF